MPFHQLPRRSPSTARIAVFILAGLAVHWPAIAVAQAARLSTLPHDLSPVGMFMAADIVVKSVMIGLIAASVISWTVFLFKSVELWAANRRISRALPAVTHSASLTDAAADLQGADNVVSRMLRGATAEIARSRPAANPAGIQQRVASQLADIAARNARNMTLGTGILATIGSTAPFVGLFGTVWGIMNAFIGISETQTTSLAVVAPGIAEALLATALGLVAAIPAVVFYNIFARAMGGYRQRLGMVASGIERQLSSDLDRLQMPAGGL